MTYRPPITGPLVLKNPATNPPISTAGEARIYKDSVSGLVASQNGGAYAAIGSGGSGSSVQINYTNASGGALSQGDCVYQLTSAASSVDKATAAADDGLAHVLGWLVPATLANTVSGAFAAEGQVTARFEASLTLARGDEVFLSASTAGRITNVAPSTSGQVIQSLGFITDALTYNGTSDLLAQIQIVRGPKAVL